MWLRQGRRQDLSDIRRCLGYGVRVWESLLSFAGHSSAPSLIRRTPPPVPCHAHRLVSLPLSSPAGPAAPGHCSGHSLCLNALSPPQPLDSLTSKLLVSHPCPPPLNQVRSPSEGGTLSGPLVYDDFLFCLPYKTMLSEARTQLPSLLASQHRNVSQQ